MYVLIYLKIILQFFAIYRALCSLDTVIFFTTSWHSNFKSLVFAPLKNKFQMYFERMMLKYFEKKPSQVLPCPPFKKVILSFYYTFYISLEMEKY